MHFGLFTLSTREYSFKNYLKYHFQFQLDAQNERHTVLCVCTLYVYMLISLTVNLHNEMKVAFHFEHS